MGPKRENTFGKAGEGVSFQRGRVSHCVLSRGVIRFAHQRGVSLRSRGVDFVHGGVSGCAL